MFVLGLTGPIGSGKSTIAAYLQKEGYIWVEVDKIGHSFLQVTSPVHSQIKELFGTDSRASIREQVFTYPGKLAELNCLVHPLIKEAVRLQLADLEKTGVSRVLLDAALLYEIGLGELCDGVWGVSADTQQIKSRMETKGWGRNIIDNVLKVQKDREFLQKNADVLIENNGSIEELRKSVLKEVEKAANSK
ncbi:MAG: dephospho-CoA kinase [Candidatus Margulisiibacteriota bacterium]